MGVKPRLFELRELEAADDSWQATREQVLQAVHATMTMVALAGADRPVMCLWALDVLVTGRARELAAFLLEINVFPQIYRRQEDINVAMDRILEDVVAPVLGHAMSSHPPEEEPRNETSVDG